MKLLLLLSALLAALPASPQTKLSDINTRGVLRVGSTGDYKPFSYRSGKDFIGLDIDLAGELAQAMGVKLVVVPTTWPTLMSDFSAGKLDIALSGVSVTAERQQQADFSVSYLSDGKTPITRCGNEARFQTLEQINQPGVRLIVNPGGTNERFARRYAPQAQLTVYPDNVTIFGQIVAGAADLMITDAIEAHLQQRLHPQLCAVHPGQPFDHAERAVLLPRDPALKAYVDQWLGARIASGSLQQRLEHWVAFAWNLEPLRQAIDQRLLLAPAVARAKWNVQAPIEDLPREAQVIAAAVRQGRALGLPDAWVETVFKAQIEASKTVQRELYAQWRREQADHFSDAPDLANTIRPELDRITSQLLRAMSDNQAVLKSAANNMRPLDAAALSPTAAAQALAPFAN